jgi:hypothetical protein
MLLGIPAFMVTGAVLILFGLFSPLLVPVTTRSSARESAREPLPRREAGFVFGSPVTSSGASKAEEIARHLDEARRLLADEDDPDASKGLDKQ